MIYTNVHLGNQRRAYLLSLYLLFAIFAKTSVTWLGDFLKFFETNIHAKVAQILGNILGFLKT